MGRHDVSVHYQGVPSFVPVSFQLNWRADMEEDGLLLLPSVLSWTFLAVWWRHLVSVIYGSRSRNICGLRWVRRFALPPWRMPYRVSLLAPRTRWCLAVFVAAQLLQLGLTVGTIQLLTVADLFVMYALFAGSWWLRVIGSYELQHFVWAAVRRRNLRYMFRRSVFVRLLSIPYECVVCLGPLPAWGSG